MKNFRTIAFLLASTALVFTGPAYASGGGKPKESKASEARPFGTKSISTATENFVEFYPSAATIFNGHRPAGFMHFEYGLDIIDPRIRERAIKMAPLLRDAYGRILSQYAGSIYSLGEVPDMNYLTTRMQGITDRIIGKGKAKFLVANLMVREK